MHLTRLFAVVALAAAVTAQNPPPLTAHPQDSTQHGGGNLSPLGVWSDGSYCDARSMLLVPKHELPSVPATLWGIQVNGWSTASLLYAMLNINVGPTTATSLQSVFALNHQVAPTPVLQATNLSVSYSSTNWTTIAFTQPYLHDGTSAMVIEIQKVVQYVGGLPVMIMNGSGQPPRIDRPNMVYVTGNVGSGAWHAASATVATNPIAVRLMWTITPTLRTRSDNSLLVNQYSLGTFVTLTLNGPANDFYIMSAAPSFLPVAVPITGIGELRLNGGFSFASGLLDANGVATFQLAIPWNSALVGLYLAYQGATVNLVNLSIALTNGTDHFVNP